MSKETKIGTNRTGMQMSPEDGRELAAAAQSALPTSDAGGESPASIRASYVRDAEPLGSVPPPRTMKGMLKSGMDMLTGDRPQVLLDKMGERLAFERAGTRLYDGLLMKIDAMADTDGTYGGTLQRFRNEEAAHFEMLYEAIETLGGDPTAQTPSADLTGVQSSGLMQSLNDPRTTLTQCLGTVLIAELADAAGWEVLIDLAQASGHDDLARRFQGALAEEGRHMQQIRDWYSELMLNALHLLGKPSPVASESTASTDA
jgi:hypothetical protein